LLVVIAIIGILSAIGLVSLNGAREKARDAQRKSDLGQMNTALVLYYDDHSSQYPAQTATDAVTDADCIDSTGAVTYPQAKDAVSPLVNQTGGALNLWLSTGGIVPTYLSRELVPPTGEDWSDIYCYDTNEAHATSPYSSYVIYAGLEAGTGLNAFTLNSAGDSDEDATLPVACTAQDTCLID
ncbi:MAG: type II secretion system protein, partial [Patescibacteria group bacterium]